MDTTHTRQYSPNALMVSKFIELGYLYIHIYLRSYQVSQYPIFSEALAYNNSMLNFEE